MRDFFHECVRLSVWDSLIILKLRGQKICVLNAGIVVVYKNLKPVSLFTWERCFIHICHRIFTLI